MKKSILKQMAEAEIGAATPLRRHSSDAQEARRHSSPVISNVGRALVQLSEDSIVSLDATKIERSPFKDRFAADEQSAEELEALKLSILSEGQKIPVLVRPHPTKSGLYQLAYGYRRVAAIQALNEEDGRQEPIKVRAYVRNLTDRQLIEEQSVENGVREGLTWIEQAMWTLQLKAVGLSQRAICPILGLSESAISHFGKVTSIIPADVVYAIGRAKSVGRPKWTALAVAMEGKTDIAIATVKTEAFLRAETEGRFKVLFDSLSGASSDEAGTKTQASAVTWRSLDETLAVTMHPKANKVAVEISNDGALPFSDWLAKSLDRLYDEFMQSEQVNQESK